MLRRFQTPLLQFLRHRGPAADAEDLLQETFLRAYENLHRYRPRWAFSAWLFTIARRTSINHGRRIRPGTDPAAVAAVASAEAEPLDALVAAESRRRLWDLAAGVLSEEQLTALWLHYVEEMPARQIALVLGRSRGSVKIMLFRAGRSCCRCWPSSTAGSGKNRPRTLRAAQGESGGRLCLETENQPDVMLQQSHGFPSVGVDPLANRLRREAIESWPDFSETLHRRMVAAVEARRAPAAQRGKHAAFSPAGRRLSAPGCGYWLASPSRPGRGRPEGPDRAERL